VHRVTALYILTPILGAGGLACLAPAVGRFPGAGPLPWIGLCLFGAACAAGLAAAFVTHSRCGRVARHLKELVAAGRLAPLAGRAGTDSVTDTVNELISFADRAVSEAAVKARELEILLKIATAERQHAEAIIYSISDAVLVTDTFDELVLANESAARTFEFDLGVAHRRRVDHVLKDPKVVSLIREMRQSDAPRGRRVVEHRVRTGAGDRTFKITLSTVAGGTPERTSGGAASAALSPGTGPEGSPPSGVVAVLHDVTHEKEVSEMKNDFVSNVSHELRTPLASIKAYVELLIDGEADDEKTKREFYEVIQNEANRLGRLIDNILNISRIESGLVKVERKPLSLTVVVKDALEVIAPQAAQKNVALVERLTPVFYQTLGDRDMLYQAVLNVLSNAVKYTPGGGEIRVETTVDESRRKVVTRVTDTGVGIPAQDLPFVFDKFYRAESNNRVAPGTGLGLSLVKHIVEVVHHGRMFAESQVGKGSTFGFELDLCE
jgi:two-component system phosphate regulon sensor histidine kinase PhoR